MLLVEELLNRRTRRQRTIDVVEHACDEPPPSGRAQQREAQRTEQPSWRAHARAALQRWRSRVLGTEISQIVERQANLRREKEVGALTARHHPEGHRVVSCRQALDDVPPAERRILTLGCQMYVMTAPRELLDDRFEITEIPVMQRCEQDSQRKPVRWMNIS